MIYQIKKKNDYDFTIVCIYLNDLNNIGKLKII